MGNKKLLSNAALLLILSVFQIQSVMAQMVGVNAYIKATSLELGIAGAGGFEGAPTTASPVPIGMHFRSGNPYFGFVSNPQVNAWATFDGDFFTPGSPENGWGFRIGSAGAQGSNNCSFQNDIPGAITSWTHTGSCYSCTWDGDTPAALGTNLHWKVNYFLQQTDLYYTTTVSVTNNTAATIPDLYYYRNVDPDNDESISGDFTTNNTVVAQPTSGLCNTAHVSATSVVPASQPQSYMGFAATGATWRAGYGGFSNRDGYLMWTGTGFVQTVGVPQFADEAIYIANHITNLLPGTTQTFKFVVILDDLAAANAVAGTTTLTYPGSPVGTPTACTTHADTVKICQGVPATVSVTGPNIASYNWSWSPTTGLSPTTGPSTSANPATTTSYTVTGTPINACFAAVSFPFIVQVTPSPIVNPVANITTCPGSIVPISTFTSTPLGATYTWTNSNTAIGLGASGAGQVPAFTATNATGAAITANITVTPTIAGSPCPGIPLTYTITVNPKPVITAPANITVCAGTAIPATTITSTPAGATYTWTNSNPAIGLAVSGAGQVPAFTGTNITAVPISGTITVTPTLAGCTGTPVTYTITINPLPTSTFTQSANQCFTGNSFNFTNTGTAGATYSWTFTSGTPATSTLASPTGITYPAAGTYTVTHLVTAAGGCTSTTTSTVTVYPQPTGLTASSTPAACGATNGTITISTGIGGTGPYTYSLDGGAFSATLTYSGLAAGVHTIIVKDVNGCTFTTTVTIAGSPGPSALAVTTINSTCGNPNGIINIGATTGGVAPYTYSVNASAYTATTSYPGFAAGTYTIIVKDANGCTYTTTATVTNTPGPTALATTTINSTCGLSNGTVNVGAVTGGTAAYTYSFNGSAFTATTSYTGLAAGTYTVVVHDANGCAFTVNPVVSNTTGPTALIVTPGNSTCGNSNGTITIGATTGGTPPYTYSVAASAFTATTSYTGFAAGTYTIIVKDANGCTFTTSTTITNTPGPTAVVVTTGNSSCGASNGTINLGAVTGGVPPYTFSVNASAFTGTLAYTGFAAGTYTVVVKDANGCTFTTSALVNNSSGPTGLAVTPTNANCGASNGTVTIGAVTGGIPVYTYSFNASAFSSTTSYTGIAAGTYNVVVKDGNGCTYTTTVTVNNIPGPTALATTIVNSTCGASNGIVNIGATTGGTGPYTYSFNGGAFSGTVSYTGLAAGTYTVTVKDINGCTFTINPVVGANPGPTALATTTTNSTCGASNGTVTIGTTTGGTAPYTYSFNASAFTATVNYTGLAAGTYTVVVKDANGCTFTVNPIVVNTPGPTALARTIVNSTCGSANGAINIGATTGGTPAYTYSFNGGGFTSTTSYTGLAAGTYTITVKDANGCTFTINPVVPNIAGPTALATTTTSSTCGGTNGAITIGATTGGTPTYTYSVNGSPYTATTSYTGLAANTYPVIVQDANGCQFATTATVTDLSGLVASITAQTNVSCNGGSNGTVTVTASGSTAPYSYSFNGGAFGGTGTFSGLTQGSYTVTAKDGNGCTVTVPVSITQPTPLVGVITAQTNVACFGGNTGSVTVSASGGTNPYVYSIDLGTFGPSAIFGGLTAGPHTITVKDGNGCTVTIAVTITQPAALVLTTSSTNATCSAANGSATVAVTGGTAGYTYLWTPSGQTTPTATSVTANNYSVLVTDANSCTQTATVNVGANPGATAVISSSTNATCTGANDGTATVSMGAGGTPPFTYAWTPSSQTTVTATGLSPGSYTVTVTDGNGCIATANTVITEPTVISTTFTNINVSCFGGTNGESTINATGGTPIYNYFWTPSGQTTASAFGLAAGTYSCTVTDAHGCTHTVSTVITQPTGMTLTSTHVDANCGLSNGSATVIVAGGTGPYTYSWSTVPVQTTANAINLASNTYVVTVTDANGCSQTLPVTIGNLAGPVATLFSSTNVSCNGLNDGSATVTVTGGSMPYMFGWSNGQSVPTATNLVAGTYTLTATDGSGCVATTSVTITEPTLLDATTVAVNPSCFGSCNGHINSLAVGGTTPYSYLWSPGAATTTNVTGLCAGTYTLQVTDAHGCIVTKTNTLTDPIPVTLTATTTNVTCSGLCNGSSVANPTSGTGPYTYAWNDINLQTTQTATGLCAGNYTVTVTDANGCSASAPTTVTSPVSLTTSITSEGNVSCHGACDGFAGVTVVGGSAPFSYNWMPGATAGANVNNLCAGTYTVTTTDANGCSAISTVTITEPTALTATISSTNVTCFGACNGSATAVYNGGTGPYTFQWTPGFQTTPTIAGVCAGVQNLTVTDANGCTASSTATITEPTVLAVTTTTTNSNCGVANGSACASITGGVPPFSYSWNDPANQTSSCANSINAGVYTISVTDAHGCSVTAVANVNDNTAPVVTIPTSTNVTCHGAANGSAQANIVGGMLPYNIMWTPSSETTAFASGLSGGVYSVVVTDSVGCIGTSSVTINEPATLVSGIVSSSNVSCFLSCDGSATVNAGGGTTPYTYLWNDGATQTTPAATGLCAQGYTVTITDANGCVTTSNTALTSPTALNVTLLSSTNVSCNGGNNGAISISVSGGTPGYTYTWTPGVGSGSLVTGLTAGTYTVLVTDTHGCTVTATYTITQPTPVLLSTISNPSTCGHSNGSVSVTPAGGTPGYTYLWDDPSNQTTAIATNLAAGPYSVVVTDNHGCVADTFIVLTNTAGPTISAITYTEPTCHGTPLGTATVIAAGGVPSYSYLWTGPGAQTTVTASALTVGTYSVTVTDANGCTTTGSVNVTEPTPTQVLVNPIDTICIGEIAQVYGSGYGGTPGYNYTWVPSTFLGAGPHTVSPTVTTSYSVYVTDANGCTSPTVNAIVFVHPPITLTATDASVCAGSSVGISATAGGGNGGPYTYAWTPSTGLSSSTISNPTATPASTTNYIVTANDGCSLPITDTSTVTVNPLAISFMSANDTAGCQAFTVQLTALSNIGTSYVWNFGDGTPTQTGTPVTHTYPTPGSYNVTLTTTTALGCTSSITTNSFIDVYPTPTADFISTPSAPTTTEPTVSFIDQSTGENSWSWDFMDQVPFIGLHTDTLQNPVYTYADSGSYNVQLVVGNSFGCYDTAYHPVYIAPEYVIYVPSAFTPGNHDGLNDTFRAYGVGIDPNNYEMDIFDRWGNLIFKTTDFERGWDGKVTGSDTIAQIDVYIWKVKAKDYKGNNHSYVGHVTIVK